MRNVSGKLSKFFFLLLLGGCVQHERNHPSAEVMFVDVQDVTCPVSVDSGIFCPLGRVEEDGARSLTIEKISVTDDGWMELEVRMNNTSEYKREILILAGSVVPEFDLKVETVEGQVVHIFRVARNSLIHSLPQLIELKGKETCIIRQHAWLEGIGKDDRLRITVLSPIDGSLVCKETKVFPSVADGPWRGKGFVPWERLTKGEVETIKSSIHKRGTCEI